MVPAVRLIKTLQDTGYVQQQQQNSKKSKALAKNYESIGKAHFIADASSTAVQQTTLEE